MKRTYKDIHRHAAIMSNLIEAINRELDSHDLPNEERIFLVRELTITGLSVAGLRNPEDFGKIVTEAADRIVNYDDTEDLLINGVINPKLKNKPCAP